MGKHYVPQEYLRAFSADSSQTIVWMFDKRSREWQNAAIAKVAQQRGYFSEEVEKELNKFVEGPGHIALRTIRGGQMLERQMGGDLLSYIAVMMMRVPKKRRLSLSIVPGSIDRVISTTRDQISSLKSPETDQRVEELLAEIDRIEQRAYLEIPEQMAEQIESPWPTKKVLEGVHSMCWRLVTVPDDSPLITSDNPAFYFSAYGIGSAESELTFPISPQLALLGSRQGPPGEVIVLSEKRPIAKEITRRIAVGAERFIFAARPYSWVQKISQRSEPDLNRIKWRDVA